MECNPGWGCGKFGPLEISTVKVLDAKQSMKTAKTDEAEEPWPDIPASGGMGKDWDGQRLLSSNALGKQPDQLQASPQCRLLSTSEEDSFSCGV